MALAGAGAVAIWNDITPEGRSNFYEWHSRQHTPERIAIPEFLTGRRYVAQYGTPEYFTLYETATTAALSGEHYLARLNSPTDWTVRSTSHFRNVARALCHVERSAGDAVGGLMATWRYEIRVDRAAHIERMAHAVPVLAERPGVAGAHFLITDPVASGTDTEERKRRGDPNHVPNWIFLVEGWGDLEPFESLCRGINAQYFDSDAVDIEHGVYRLQAFLAAPGDTR